MIKKELLEKESLKKELPLTKEQLMELIREYGSPFHLYVEKDIRANARKLNRVFSWAYGFREFFAVKALPNPYILRILQEEGFGVDCSSMTELLLAEKTGLSGGDIFFSSNNTPAAEFIKAREMNVLMNIDDISYLDDLSSLNAWGDFICFRYNPGANRGGGNEIIGFPENAKYGLTKEQIFMAIRKAADHGVSRFGLHTMIVSNELNTDYLVGTATMMFELASEVYERLGVAVELVNLGGGIGIPYLDGELPVDLEEYAGRVREEYGRILLPRGLDKVRICLESGRMITGPYGFLVSKVLHKKDIYKQYVGLDACMADLMRPGLYGAYHHITIAGKEDWPKDHTYDIVGSLCENNDKFAVDRPMPRIEIGDIAVIHDTGAHGYAMGFNYNGKLRSRELLLRQDGSVRQIRRAETAEDLFATLDFSGL